MVFSDISTINNLAICGHLKYITYNPILTVCEHKLVFKELIRWVGRPWSLKSTSTYSIFLEFSLQSYKTFFMLDSTEL